MTWSEGKAYLEQNLQNLVTCRMRGCNGAERRLTPHPPPCRLSSLLGEGFRGLWALPPGVLRWLLGALGWMLGEAGVEGRDASAWCSGSLLGSVCSEFHACFSSQVLSFFPKGFVAL